MTALRHFLRTFGEAFTEFTTAHTLSDDDYARGRFCSFTCHVQRSEARTHTDLNANFKSINISSRYLANKPHYLRVVLVNVNKLKQGSGAHPH